MEENRNETYITIQQLMKELDSTGKHYDREKILKAYDFSAMLHEGQFRQSGEPYITHPLSVACIAVSLGLDTDSVCAALLHDTVEDCADKVNLAVIKKEFGQTVANLVDGLTKLVEFPFEDKEEAHMENLRKMFLAMSKDIRVLFIKLCDRVHNMRTLDGKPEEKRRVIALETMYVYAPLAHRLGMQKIKQELEKRSLSYLDPIGYEEVRHDIMRKFGENKDFLQRAKDLVSEKLEENNIKFTLQGRVKSVYSIYKKMYNQNKSFDEIYDFYAIRIIVDTELECYTVLGIIHDMFHSMPGRFKDYISTPKPNMYRSLHTTVIGRDGIPFEVQIRTYEMHQIAEYGIAANWKYKTGATASADIDKKLKWISEFVETENDTKDPDEFLNALKVDIFQDEVFAFTPKGDVIALPSGSTVIDFAYAIHSAVGNKMVGAKVNGMIVPIDHVLANGEIIEILTSSQSKGPSRDWLKIVKTGDARNKIRQWFKKEQRAENIVMGKAEIDRELHRFGYTCSEAQKNEVVLNVARRIGIQDVDDAYNIIGYGGLNVSKISAKLKDEFERIVKPSTAEKPTLDDMAQANKKKVKKSTSGVIVDGVDGCVVKFAKCCTPIPGDAILGFITKGFGISIHRSDCANIRPQLENYENKDRFVSAEWANSKDDGMFESTVCVVAHNSINVVADLTAAVAEMRVNLIAINMQNENGAITVNLTLCCRNTEHLHQIISRLRAIKDVENVTRG